MADTEVSGLNKEAWFEECFDIALTVEKLSISELDMKDTSCYTTTEKFIVNKTGQIW